MRPIPPGNPLIRALSYLGRFWRAAGMALKGDPTRGFDYGAFLPGQPLPLLDSADALAEVMHRDPWVMIGVTRIAQSVAASPLVAQVQTPVDGELVWQDLRVGELADLLAHPNPTEGMDVLLYKVTLSSFTGNGYLILDDSGGRLALYHCRPQIIRAVLNESGALDYWRLNVGTREKSLPLDQVIHISCPSILSDVYGQSPLTALRSKILLNKYYSNHLATFFLNAAVPSGILKSPSFVTAEQQEQAKKAWRAAYAGPDNAHSIAVLGDDYEYQQVSPPLRDMLVEALHTIPRDTTLSAIGVPPIMAGIEAANYATAREQRRSFWQDTVIPRQAIIASALTIQLARRFGEDHRIVPDNSQVEALQPDRNKQAQLAYRLYQGRIATLNESRKIVDLQAVDDGDEFLAMPAVAVSDANYDSDGGDVADRGARARGILVKATRSPLESRWQEYYQLALDREKGLANLMRQYWAGQEKRALEGLRELLGVKRNQFMRTSLLMAIKAGDDGGGVLDPEAERAKLAALADPFVVKRMKEAGERGMNQARVDLTFDVTRPEVRLKIDEIQNRIVGINDYTYERIRELLDEAYTEGYGYDLTAQKLIDLYGDFKKERALTIARTETGSVLNGGAFLAYEQASVERKRWLPAYLPTSRSWHTDMGEVAPIGLKERFSVGGTPMLHPHDPAGGPANVINCYCTLMAVLTEDEEG